MRNAMPKALLFPMRYGQLLRSYSAWARINSSSISCDSSCRQQFRLIASLWAGSPRVDEVSRSITGYILLSHSDSPFIQVACHSLWTAEISGPPEISPLVTRSAILSAWTKSSAKRPAMSSHVCLHVRFSPFNALSFPRCFPCFTPCQKKRERKRV